ncbi:MAG TPA: hypothetical protein VH619_10145 [Verrucomicrobiae bacterium]|jgi:TolA-binding protein|nr:hypothetical protein [Verrucomicrobiae bacterium]
MSNKTVEHLRNLVQERRNIIEGRETQIEALRRDIERLKAEIRGLELAIEACGDGQAAGRAAKEVVGAKYANMGPTDAVLAVVRAAAEEQPLGLTVREIREALVAGGFTTESQDLYNTVYPIALGLVKQGRFKESKKNFKRSFLPGDLPDK